MQILSVKIIPFFNKAVRALAKIGSNEKSPNLYWIDLASNREIDASQGQLSGAERFIKSSKFEDRGADMAMPNQPKPSQRLMQKTPANPAFFKVNKTDSYLDCGSATISRDHTQHAKSH